MTDLLVVLVSMLSVFFLETAVMQGSIMFVFDVLLQGAVSTSMMKSLL